MRASNMTMTAVQKQDIVATMTMVLNEALLETAWDDSMYSGGLTKLVGVGVAITEEELIVGNMCSIDTLGCRPILLLLTLDASMSLRNPTREVTSSSLSWLRRV